MRKVLFISVLSLLILTFPLYGGGVRAHMGSGMMGPGMMGGGGYGGWNSPYCGQSMGPQGGYGMGPGMMGPGYQGYGPQYAPPSGPQYQQPQKPMEEKDAKTILESYLGSMRNPNLKLGKIKEMGNYFEAEILTKENSLVDKVLVDKFSGRMRSIY
jgi:hypothetical protein